MGHGEHLLHQTRETSAERPEPARDEAHHHGPGVPAAGGDVAAGWEQLEPACAVFQLLLHICKESNFPEEHPVLQKLQFLLLPPGSSNIQTERRQEELCLEDRQMGYHYLTEDKTLLADGNVIRFLSTLDSGGLLASPAPTPTPPPSTCSVPTLLGHRGSGGLSHFTYLNYRILDFCLPVPLRPHRDLRLQSDWH